MTTVYKENNHGKKMNLFYISPRDMRKNRADPVHTMYSCQTFARLGWIVTLVTPLVLRTDWKVTKQKIWSLYNDMSPDFRIIELPTFIKDTSNNPVTIRISKFICFLFYYLINIRRLNRNSVIYAHCYISVLPAVLLKKTGLLRAKLFYEKAEFFPDNRIHKYIIRNMDGIIAINDFIRSRTADIYDIDYSKLIKLPFTSQSDQLTALISKTGKRNIRKELGLDPTKIYITYSGKLSEKSVEVNYILEAAKIISGNDLVILFIGGKESAVNKLISYCRSSGINNVEFHGYQTLSNLYRYVIASDVLVSYYDTLHDVHINQRVPAKMSVYLSSGNPLILADLPCLREWWSDEHVFYVQPDKPQLLAEKMIYVVDHPEEARQKAIACRIFADENTYESAYVYVSNFLHRIRKSG